MLHVTATAASESRNDGAVRRNCYWLDRGVAHITSERKRVGGGEGSRKSDGKKNVGLLSTYICDLYMWSCLSICLMCTNALHLHSWRLGEEGGEDET